MLRSRCAGALGSLLILEDRIDITGIRDPLFETNAHRLETSEHHVFFSRIAAFDLDPLIVQDDDTGSESLRGGELHLHLFGLPEENLAAAHEERVDPELELVEQLSLQKRLPEAPVTIDDQVFAVLLLEFRRRRHDVAADNGAVAHSAFLKVFEKTC